MDYREFLKNELASRRRRRPSYSLRAFSRDLGLSPSYLSALLDQKKNLSEAKAGDVLARLNWQDEVKQHFWLAFKKQTSRSQTVRLGYERELAKFSASKVKRQLELAEFEIVSDWINYALVELMRVRDFRPSTKWMAARLGVERARVTEALDNLIKIGLVSLEGNSYRINGEFYSSGDVSSTAIRKNHRQHLQLAARALENQSMDERDFSGVTMAIDPTRVPEAKRMIREFRRQLMAFLEGGESQRVYRLSLQLFALDSLVRSER